MSAAAHSEVSHLPTNSLLASGIYRGVVSTKPLLPEVLVEFVDGKGTFPCLLTAGAASLSKGDAVLVAVTTDQPPQRFILGVTVPANQQLKVSAKKKAVQPPSRELKPARRIKAKRLVFEGEDEIVLKTSKAMIVLRANGDIEILGERMLTRSRSQYKVSAPLIKLN